ncbi:MAG: DUF721 domain-containing protein [Candidatus Omnitrophota bacterium]
MYRNKRIHTVEEVVTAVIKQLEKAKEEPINKLRREWEKIAPKEIVKYARPAVIKNKTLIIIVDNSPWLNEINRNYKQKILEIVQEKLGQAAISGVWFKIGEV